MMTEQARPGPVRVRIAVESRSGGQRIGQEAVGDWYAKGGHAYVRYPEPAAELGRTTTVIKLETNAVKIIRQGEVRSEQTFIPGKRTIGYYETAQGKLELAVNTRSVRSSMRGPNGTALLRYDLEIAGEPAGTYTVKLTIQEERSI
ncbi:hypothetical protein SD70_25290 [Gordoniibacillus kamchatkensis]|uniref:DUF1934 domain-containing protein n=1 Tax=Gordoniibacillus kamchatkensis TaxID=1590651 RepID=A0ABR5AC44_9BACL|nr:DUF1934 domain-containing protein [Paenibacillus sp. VKM B-2647]KIL38611.1 hypothetical protein SD70_25290 [Paenibacillus sp. VKM B-2647]